MSARREGCWFELAVLIRQTKLKVEYNFIEKLEGFRCNVFILKGTPCQLLGKSSSTKILAFFLYFIVNYFPNSNVKRWWPNFLTNFKKKKKARCVKVKPLNTHLAFHCIINGVEGIFLGIDLDDIFFFFFLFFFWFIGEEQPNKSRKATSIVISEAQTLSSFH